MIPFYTLPLYTLQFHSDTARLNLNFLIIPLIMQSPNRKPSPKNAREPAVSTRNNGGGILQPSSSSGSGSSSSNSSFSGVEYKSWMKENTKPSEFKLRTQQRASQRALYNSSVAIKLYIIEEHKKQVEKVMKMIEEEEVRMLRRQMVPRAQLMPIFDKPFSPQRSTRPLTVPREPGFKMNACKQHDCSCR